MKKILSVLIALALVLAVAVPAMALTSPGGNEYRQVVVNRTGDGTNSPVPESHTVLVNSEENTVTIAPKEDSELVYRGWALYNTWDVNKKTGDPAILGKDYEIISVKVGGNMATEGVDYKIEDGRIVSLNGKALTVTIKPLIDRVYVSENYEGVVINFNISDEETAPKVGDSVTVYAVIIALIAGAVLVASRKRAF